MLRCHDPRLVELVRGGAAGSTATRSARRRATRPRCSPPGAAIEAADAGGFALVRPPGHHAAPGARDGLLHLQHGRDRRALGPGRARDRPRRDPRLGRAPRKRDAGRSFCDDPSVLFVSLHQWPFYPGTGGPDDQGETLLNMPLAAGTGTTGYLGVRPMREHAIRPVRARAAARLRRVRRPRRRPARVARALDRRFAELAARASRLAPRVAAVLEGGYNLATLPELVEAALDGFRSPA